ncbi:CDGSH iron-sulfur domain-containing protein 1 isoform X3 [Triplophysa rosa]|uniref:CDGSH iron-sulfur domain-containing protein 1 isoform X3 n=1 Tax=Triplophysa rosa TaxID=992332 RepID=UPI002545DF84|nr:CDGSH iron-sulfur domain-containing protein 1 isoform X3 [Triplophysa rosa]
MSPQVLALSAFTKPGLIPGSRDSKVAAVVSTYMLTRYFRGQSDPKSRINQTINKDSPKVVHSFDVEDIGNKVVYCRCWRSKKEVKRSAYCSSAYNHQMEPLYQFMSQDYNAHLRVKSAAGSGALIDPH